MTDHPKKLVHTSRQSCRWGDMDALGHINNTVYFRYMEQARIEWLEKVNYSLSPESEEGMVIINAACTFLIPLVYPADIEVKMYFGQVGKSSVMSFYEIRKVGDSTIYCDGSAKIVWMNYREGKSRPLPEWILNIINA
jgi:acyl-CoA thioester hydrolase